MFLTGVNVGCFCLGAVIVSLTGLSYLNRRMEILTVITVRTRTIFVRDGDQQERHKLKGKLFMRGQVENLILKQSVLNHNYASVGLGWVEFGRVMLRMRVCYISSDKQENITPLYQRRQRH